MHTCKDGVLHEILWGSLRLDMHYLSSVEVVDGLYDLVRLGYGSCSWKGKP